jgi:hypothetical protein
VLTAWKEREPGFIRRRQRIAEVEGGFVPAYADDVQVAKLADDNETEAEIAADIEAEAPAYEAVPPKGIEAPEPERAPEAATLPEPGAEPQEKAPAGAARSNGDSANPESVERRKRNDERREKRAQRRKGRRR